MMLALLTALLLLQQPMQPPVIKGPDGQNVQFKEMSQRFNFAGLKRGLFPISYNVLPLSAGELPKGAKLSDEFKAPSKKATALWEDFAAVYPEAGAPARKMFQRFTGKAGEGVAIYWEFTNTLPVDARKVICRHLYGKDEKPEKDMTDELLVHDHLVIVWSFKEPVNKAKEASQKKVFDTINAAAQVWMQQQQPQQQNK